MSVRDTVLVHHQEPRDEPTGPPIVFLPGFASTGPADWPAASWAIPFAHVGRETLVLELPGHGGAPPVTSIEQAATGQLLRRLSQAVQERVSGPVDVIGYSLGARLAWDLVGSGVLPTRRLVLGGLSPADPFPAVDIPAARDFCRSGARPTDPLTAAIAGLARDASATPEALLDLVAGLAQEPFVPSSNPPAVPTLLIAGDADEMARGAEQLVGQLADGELVQVPGDHRTALLSAEFRDVVARFLEVGSPLR